MDEKNVPSGKWQSKHRPYLTQLSSFAGRMGSASRVPGLDHSRCQVPENTVLPKLFHSWAIIIVWIWVSPIQVPLLLLGIRVSFHSMLLYFLHNKIIISSWGSHCVPGSGSKMKRVQLIAHRWHKGRLQAAILAINPYPWKF